VRGLGRRLKTPHLLELNRWRLQHAPSGAELLYGVTPEETYAIACELQGIDCSEEAHQLVRHGRTNIGGVIVQTVWTLFTPGARPGAWRFRRWRTSFGF
jgi:hypothetical protein